MEVNTSLPGARVRRVIERLATHRLRAEETRVDNELNARTFSLEHKEMAGPRTKAAQRRFSLLKQRSAVAFTNKRTLAEHNKNKIRAEHGLYSTQNSVMAGWKVRALSTRSKAPQRPLREGSIHRELVIRKSVDSHHRYLLRHEPPWPSWAQLQLKPSVFDLRQTDPARDTVRTCHQRRSRACGWREGQSKHHPQARISAL